MSTRHLPPATRSTSTLLLALLVALPACGGGEGSPAGWGLAAAGASPAGEPPEVATAALQLDAEARYRPFADALAAALAASGTPGGALGIVERGRLVFATGLGLKRAGGEDPVGPDTVFRIASTTKPLTAAAVLSLEQEGRLSLDAPVTRYLPGLRLLSPFDPSRLTLRRLMSHTAGMPDYTEIDCPEGPGAVAAWFDAHPNLVLWSPPGRLWSYTNLGFTLAGRVAEQVAGRPYRDVVERRVFGPLGMSRATFDVDEVARHGDYAVAHSLEVGADINLGRCGLLEAPGYAYASVRDLGRLSEALLRGGAPVLKPWSLLQMVAPHASTQSPPDNVYGLGLMALPYRGRLIVGHPGDLPGMHSSWWLVPEVGFGVIVLVNSDRFDPTAAAVQAINTFVELDDSAPPDWSTPPSDWQRYVGYYDGAVPEGGFPAFGLGPTTVELEDEHLFLTTLDDGARYELHQAARDAFFLMVGEIPVGVTFWRDRSGRAEYLATRLGHARRSPPPPSPAEGPAVMPRQLKRTENLFERIAREQPNDPVLATWRAFGDTSAAKR